jgi:ribose transport system substrate-binding protein
MKKIVSALFIVLFVFALAACGGKTEAAVSSGSDVTSPLIGDSSEEYYMIAFLSGLDFWKICYSGMQDAGKHFNVTTQYTGQTDADAAGEAAVLEQVIAKKPKGIAIACVNTTALADTINSAVEQGISILCFDSDSPTSKRISYIAPAHEAAGETAAKYMVPLLGNKGKIAFLYTMGQENAESRIRGFKNWCAKNAPAATLLDVNDAGDTSVATDNMAAALQANGDIAGVWCADGIASFAGPVAVQESGRKNITVLACDVDPSVLDKIKSGDIVATVAQGMYSMGYWSMNFLYNHAHGLSAEPLPGYVDAGVVVVTKENVDNYYVY